jgi:phage tail-like protein
MSNGKRKDPYSVYNFLVEIDGITAGGFTDVSGLTIETTVDRRMFGGENDFEYKFITGTKYTDLTLKHGLTDVDILWNWYDEVIKGKFKRKNGTIYLRDHSEQTVMGWDFLRAFPIKWEGPAFNASSNTVAVETLVLTYQELIRKQ